MTPGFAQSREQLPWLYYPESDRVIINAHNFNQIWTPAVNGKSPVAAWIPTRSGTAEDLVGSSDGTLTNGASIITDTSAGGSEAFSLDGTNDYVTMGDVSLLDFGTGAFSCSFWFYAPPRNARAAVIAKDDFDSGSSGILFYGDVTGANTLFYWSGSVRNLGTIMNSAWHHIVVSRSSTGTNSTKIYVDGSLLLTFTDARNLTNSHPFRIGDDKDANRPFLGRVDDVRMWSQAIDATDVAALYASGSGRGVQA